ncbi:MAG: HD-GYP domain-containing protein [Deltaproteobacteria bacterium]|nr:HD-GYP domain-containing protein [Deltaproteobacteria bacterium]
MKEQAISLRLRNEEKLQLLNNMILSFVTTLEAKDKYTEGHSRRVADTAVQTAQRMGWSAREQEELHLAGLFHDIGKIGIKESVLNKAGKLTPEEYEIIKTHVTIGVRILSQIPQFGRIARIVRGHHEFYDGSGYPDGLVGEAIPVGGRILAVCDAYDAMTSSRPYRAALSVEQAASILSRNRGTQFDTKIVDAFLRSIGHEHQEKAV